MKRISLTNTDIEILEQAIINFGSVVTFQQLTSLFEEPIEYARIRISKLVNQGWLTRIKKGVYVISEFSSRGSLSISHLAIVNHLVEDSYISFENALKQHGLFDQYLSSVSTISLAQKVSRTIDGISYHFIRTKSDYFYGWEIHEIDHQNVKIATVEKALIDLIQFHRTRYSADLVLEKLVEYRGEVDFEKLIAFLQKANLTTQRIFGFLLDLAHINSEPLYNLLRNSQSISNLSRSESKIYNHKWKLYYDEYFNQYTKEETNTTTA
jgi:predicted transcriptional regulator of viral defense system